MRVVAKTRNMRRQIPIIETPRAYACVSCGRILLGLAATSQRAYDETLAGLDNLYPDRRRMVAPSRDDRVDPGVAQVALEIQPVLAQRAFELEAGAFGQSPAALVAFVGREEHAVGPQGVERVARECAHAFGHQAGAAKRLRPQ